MKAAEALASDGVEVEVIDLRTIKPLDRELILASVKKTGRLVVADVGWQSFGVSAEISALVAEEAFGALKAPVIRVALPEIARPRPVNIWKRPTTERQMTLFKRFERYVGDNRMLPVMSFPTPLPEGAIIYAI